MSEPSGEARIAGETRPAGGTTATAAVAPAPPEEFVEAAKLAPNHWLYLIDPAWSDDGPGAGPDSDVSMGRRSVRISHDSACEDCT